jgi:hypothetical protein
VITLSITLPSLYPEACITALTNIRKTTRSPYEVIVVGPFDPGRSDAVLWLYEKEQQGVAAAHFDAARIALGTFLVPFADDHAFVDGWDEIALENFVRREACAEARPFCLGLRGAHSGHVGTEFGIYYPYFPMARRADVERIGGWITADYEAGFGDSDFAMRMWAGGGRCEWSERGLLTPCPADKRKEAVDGRRPAARYTDADLALFLERWAPRYGAGWDTSHIDRFNIDVLPEMNADLAEGNTMFCNDPSFPTRVKRMPG